MRSLFRTSRINPHYNLKIPKGRRRNFGVIFVICHFVFSSTSASFLSSRVWVEMSQCHIFYRQSWPAGFVAHFSLILVFRVLESLERIFFKIIIIIFLQLSYRLVWNLLCYCIDIFGKVWREEGIALYWKPWVNSLTASSGNIGLCCGFVDCAFDGNGKGDNL